MSISLQRPCPSCKKINTLEIKKQTIYCSSCDFLIHYKCPICDSSLAGEWQSDTNGDFTKCKKCSNEIYLKKIVNLFNNLMKVSHSQACKLCNGPTVYRTQANIGHRCFNFPKCSGQASLFTQKKECLIFLDFETTGLELTKDHIIEIGALKIDPDGFEHTFDTFIKSPIKLPEKIKTITNIDDKMLEHAPEMTEVIEKFHNFIDDATIIAHNADFDVPWLLNEFIKYNLPLKNNTIICTFKWAQLMKEPRSSLSALTKKYKISHLNAHRALADAAVTKELFFIYEDAQTVARPNQSLDDFEKILNKVKLYKLKKEEKAVAQQ
tara:strand:- start:6076 stop:7044 length:969 start_codon:yes stop_codon:yes gene_type:complete